MSMVRAAWIFACPHCSAPSFDRPQLEAWTLACPQLEGALIRLPSSEGALRTSVRNIRARRTQEDERRHPPGARRCLQP